MIYNWNEFIFVNTFISSDKLKHEPSVFKTSSSIYDRLGRDRRNAQDQHFADPAGLRAADPAGLRAAEQLHRGRYRRRLGQG